MDHETAHYVDPGPVLAIEYGATAQGRDGDQDQAPPPPLHTLQFIDQKRFWKQPQMVHGRNHSGLQGIF